MLASKDCGRPGLSGVCEGPAQPHGTDWTLYKRKTLSLPLTHSKVSVSNSLTLNVDLKTKENFNCPLVQPPSQPESPTISLWMDRQPLFALSPEGTLFMPRSTSWGSRHLSVAAVFFWAELKSGPDNFLPSLWCFLNGLSAVPLTSEPCAELNSSLAPWRGVTLCQD